MQWVAFTSAGGQGAEVAIGSLFTSFLRLHGLMAIVDSTSILLNHLSEPMCCFCPCPVNGIDQVEAFLHAGAWSDLIDSNYSPHVAGQEYIRYLLFILKHRNNICCILRIWYAN